MGGLFSKPKNPGPDPELVRQRQEAEAKAKKEKADLDARNAEEKTQTASGNRGSRALLSGGFTGFKLFRETPKK
jgi:hypothetical protein